MNHDVTDSILIGKPKEKTTLRVVFSFGSPQQFRTFDDSDDFGGLFLNK